MKLLRRLILVLVVLFVIAQLIRPDRGNRPDDPRRVMSASIAVPPDVAKIYDRSCADCHSSRTRWPWYTNVAPISWWLANHVRDGRRELSSSEFATYSRASRRAS